MKYLSKIAENEGIKAYFSSAIRLGKVSHAYIIEGEKGSGKKMLAWAFARILQCDQPVSEQEDGGEYLDACGSCTSCIQIDHKDHPDVIEVRHAKPNSIGVEEIRDQVVNIMEVKPYRGPYKIYLIDEAEKMTLQAQNTILKTIEEPSEYGIIFLLTSNRGALLDTILSRCILLNIKPVSDQSMKNYLREHAKLSEQDRDFVAGFSMGNIGKALKIVESEEFNTLKDYVLDLLREIDQLQIYELADRLLTLKDYKNQVDEFLDLMLVWFRDILILKAGGEKKNIIFSREYLYLRRQCDILEFDNVNDVINLILQEAGRLKANVNFEGSMELLWLEINRAFQKEEI